MSHDEAAGEADLVHELEAVTGEVDHLLRILSAAPLAPGARRGGADASEEDRAAAEGEFDDDDDDEEEMAVVLARLRERRARGRELDRALARFTGTGEPSARAVAASEAFQARYRDAVAAEQRMPGVGGAGSGAAAAATAATTAEEEEALVSQELCLVEEDASTTRAVTALHVAKHNADAREIAGEARALAEVQRETAAMVARQGEQVDAVEAVVAEAEADSHVAVAQLAGASREQAAQWHSWGSRVGLASGAVVAGLLGGPIALAAGAVAGGVAGGAAGRAAADAAERNVDREVIAHALRQQGTAWVADEDATACQACNVTFSMLTRRHHCRQCGCVCCAACSSNTLPFVLPAPGADTNATLVKSERVCDRCFAEHGAAGGAVVVRPVGVPQHPPSNNDGDDDDDDDADDKDDQRQQQQQQQQPR